MSARFNMEDQIMACWGITTDIYDLMEEVIEGKPTPDEISNVLMGLHELYEIRFRKLFRLYEQMLKERRILTEEARRAIDIDQRALDEFVRKAAAEAEAQWETAVAKMEEEQAKAEAAAAKPKKVAKKKTASKRKS
jgi:hypothetical protein